MEQINAPQAGNNLSIAHRPEVIVDFIFEEGLFFIAVENIGDRSALKVSVRFEPGFSGAGGRLAVTELPLFKCPFQKDQPANSYHSRSSHEDV